MAKKTKAKLEVRPEAIPPASGTVVGVEVEEPVVVAEVVVRERVVVRFELEVADELALLVVATVEFEDPVEEAEAVGVAEAPPINWN